MRGLTAEVSFKRNKSTCSSTRSKDKKRTFLEDTNDPPSFYVDEVMLNGRSSTGGDEYLRGNSQASVGTESLF